MDINEMIAKCYSREKSCEFYKDKRALFLSADEYKQLMEWLEELKELRGRKND